MNKLFCLILLISVGYGAQCQDTSHIKFKPGTLVGKYYGTYDTSAKKPVEVINTNKVSQIQVSGSEGPVGLPNSSVASQPQLQVNKNNDLLDAYTTKPSSQLQVAAPGRQPRLENKSLSAQPKLQVNKNNDLLDTYSTQQAQGLQVTNSPVTGNETSNQLLATPNPVRSNVNYAPVNTGAPATSYRSTRLGSSSPLYRTYQTNDNGAGSITTGNKGGGSATPVNLDNDLATQAGQQARTVYRDTRLGSSTPQYDTYKKNDNGAGAVTTSDKSGAGSMQPVYSDKTNVNTPLKQPPSFYRDTRLGSSTPQYDSYKKNDDGAGSVTTSVKSGGSANPSAIVDYHAQNQGPEKSGEHIYRDTRLGSSSPMYKTYRTNDDGAGSVTTNPNKGGGGYVPVVEPIKPEQASPDSSANVKGDIRTMEKRGN